SVFQMAHSWVVSFQDEMTSSLGLTTKKALTILRDQLSALLEGHQKERKKVTSWREVWRSSFLYHGNRCSCFHWPGASLMLLAVLLLLCCYGSQPQGSQGAEIVNALALFLLLLLDLFMIGRQERLKCREVERRLQTIIDKINGEVSFICFSFPFVFSSHWIFLQA
uniref:Transmembrane protein 94 n=1 Tax=Buteo japonicus TaxID=224669 RepID=A0A8C0BH48_9AVES